MHVGIAAGHSMITDIESRAYEFQLCFKTVVALREIWGKHGTRSNIKLTFFPHEKYNQENNPALRDKTNFFNAHIDLDMAIEIHLNAGGGNYSTVLCWGGGDSVSVKGKEYGDQFAKALDESFPWRSIGCQPQTYFNRNLWFLNKCKAPALILEAGFKDFAAHKSTFDDVDFPLRHALSILSALYKIKDEKAALHE